MANWFFETKRADFDEIAKKYGISPMTARLLRNRDINTDEEIAYFLHGTKEDLYDPFLMKDMEKAVSLLVCYAKQKKHIRIIGDYDIDGVCSAYILKKGISVFLQSIQKDNGRIPDAGKVDARTEPEACIDIRIPHRVSDGYGLNERLIDEAAEDFVDLIITCDNGIAAADQIKKAKSAGIAVIVTDHHEVPYDEADGARTYLIPPADAVVDPKQEDCSYPFKGICGAAVAYKLICALYVRGLPDIEYENSGFASAADKKKRAAVFEALEECFALAAFATVGDVMELVDENHLIVKYGLPLIADCKNAGLRALIRECGISGKPITPYHIGFVLGPCFNASGRLDDAYRVIDLLQAETEEEAVRLAGEVRRLNTERQDLTEKGMDEAVRITDENKLAEAKVLVVYLPDVHESLAGIIAGRLRKKYGRPTFVLTDGEEGIKGSGRSTECYHMFDEMTKIKDIFVKYGGHKMAAGLSLPFGAADEFRSRINEVCTLSEEDFEERLVLDMPLPLPYVSFSLMKELKLLEPYGNGNSSPLFGERVAVYGVRVMGANRNVVKCKLKSINERNEETGSLYDGICFCEGDEFSDAYEKSNKTAKIAYTPQENTYNGMTSIQIQIKQIEWYHSNEKTGQSV